MATYRAIKGLTIRTVDGDLSNVALGDIWYNKAISTRKMKVGNLSESWASGGNLNTARYKAAAAGASLTAALNISGFTPSFLAIVEQYDGTSWTEIADINTARDAGGASGTITAAFITGGEDGPGGPGKLVATERAAFTLVFTDSTQGWLLKDK